MYLFGNRETAGIKTKRNPVTVKKKKKMSSEAKSGGSSNGGGGGGFRARMEHYFYSGEKKHVLAGIAIISVVFGIPWVLMNRGLYSLHSLYNPYYASISLKYRVVMAMEVYSQSRFEISCSGFFSKTCFLDTKRVKLRNLG